MLLPLFIFVGDKVGGEKEEREVCVDEGPGCCGPGGGRTRVGRVFVPPPFGFDISRLRPKSRLAIPPPPQSTSL